MAAARARRAPQVSRSRELAPPPARPLPALLAALLAALLLLAAWLPPADAAVVLSKAQTEKLFRDSAGAKARAAKAAAPPRPTPAPTEAPAEEVEAEL